MSPVLVLATCLAAQSLPPGYWPLADSGPILEKTATTRLAPDLSALTEAERVAVRELLATGAIMQELYELSRHPQALDAKAALAKLHDDTGRGPATESLLTLYRLFQGPIASTLDNARKPFVPVDPQQPGKNVYPAGLTKAELDAYLAAHPAERAELLAERTVVRRATKESIEADLLTLARHPALALLHPRVKPRLLAHAKRPSTTAFYAVPYAIAYADRLVRAYHHLDTAAEALATESPELAGYLRARARDLVTNDYESGDAAWVTGRFGRLNAQIGAYETYDDALYGAKAFHSLSLLSKDEAETAALERAIGGLQALEDSLPYDAPARVKDGISVGIYDVIADFGQARGTNTATILPNDPLHARRYGRTILLRRNIMRDPEIFASAKAVWDVAVAPGFRGDLGPDGDFYRTLWHELGHYLGAHQTKDGRDVSAALEEHADAMEELKSDLVSLYLVPALAKRGYHDAARVKQIYAAGVRRTLQSTKPRSDQPYQTMMLAQLNYFLEKGLLTWDPASKTLSIAYAKYPQVVGAMLREVLAIQRAGDRAAAGQFLARWGAWTPELHDALAEKLRAAQKVRYRLVRYGALGE
ncbi:NUDIX hydrolase [Myxococcota bacterium]|nr:NUDIX hydrolase [Myxococcota bacterium]